MKPEFLFTSERLGFRNWQDQDVDLMTEISSDPEVMKFFPSIQTREETQAFIQRMQALFNEEGFCYFAAEELSTKQLIGFIGFAIPSFEATFMPCIDMGWRLSSKIWGKGYATEGALRCLTYGFNELNLENVKAIAPVLNVPSIKVMKNIGMKLQLEFLHPKLKDCKTLEKCVCYEISRS